MMTMVISGSDGVTFPDSTNQFSGGAFSFKNRIINGDMRIAQRGTAAVSSSGSFPVDRFWYAVTGADQLVFTGQQSTTVPAGFINSILTTVTTAETSWESGEFFGIRQYIEGTNVADLGWGTANAKTVTLSFWTRSSLTGTFGGALRNNAANRTYAFEYTISSADTWEYKTVTIPGDTSGTWLTDTGAGIQLFFCLGAGSDRLISAGSWQSATAIGATGQVLLGSTLNATWYVTGVQLEVGSVATPFERRPFGAELALCMRYYEQTDTISGFNAAPTSIGITGTFSSGLRWNTRKRAAPTVVIYDRTGTANKVSRIVDGVTVGTTVTATNIGVLGFQSLTDSAAGFGTGAGYEANYTASAEL